MGHVDPHTIKIIPAAAKRFMGAKRYAVVGRVLQDPAKFDNKVGGASAGARTARREALEGGVGEEGREGTRSVEEC
jgi:hypothetical protein